MQSLFKRNVPIEIQSNVPCYPKYIQIHKGLLIPEQTGRLGTVASNTPHRKFVIHKTILYVTLYEQVRRQVKTKFYLKIIKYIINRRPDLECTSLTAPNLPIPSGYSVLNLISFHDHRSHVHSADIS